MPQQLIGISGSLGSPSKTHALVGAVAARVSAQFGTATTLHDLDAFGPSLGQARSLADLAPEARALVDRVIAADALIVGSPVYKGSYAETISSGITAYRTGAAPHLLQVFEVGNGTMAAAIGAVRPVATVMREAGLSVAVVSPVGMPPSPVSSSPASRLTPRTS